MSTTPKPAAKPAPTPKTGKGKAALLASVKALQEKADANQKKIDEIAKQPDYRGKNLAEIFANRQAPYGTSGKLGEQSYSFAKATGNVMDYVSDESAKEERQIGQKLLAYYQSQGYIKTIAKSLLIPWSTNWIPTDSSAGEALQREIREKMAIQRGYDPQQFAYELKKAGFQGKALGTLIDTAGGTFVAGPTLGELIDLQRNLEVFARSGASEIGLAPNGRMMFPKLVGGATSAWAGEAEPGVESQQTTGDLLLEAKKLMTFVRLNNELYRFSSVGVEALIRGDMARSSALKADLAMLEGTGGTQIKGLLTYTTDTSWTQGTDKVLRVRATTQDDTNGDTMQPQDFRILESSLPDEVENTAWVMRKNMFGILTTRRADAITAADAKGVFVVNMYQDDFEGRQVESINGKPVVKSSQVSKTRLSSDATAGKSLTYVLTGFFPDWIIARSGVAEIANNPYGNGAFENDQNILRLIQILDAGPRHLASFAYMDFLKQL